MEEKTEQAKITPPEMIFFGLWSLFADIGEIVGAFTAAIPVAGWGIWLLAWAFGMLTSAVLFIWLMFRGGSFTGAKTVAKKLVVFALGSAADSLTAGVLPLRTISLVVAIWMHNHPKLTAVAGQAVAGRAARTGGVVK